MDSLNHMNQAIQYIEENLTQKIDFKIAAQRAYLSEYHLSRLFTQLFGMSISEYVRRRRLTVAAYDLQNSDEKVMDLALKYDYDSADSFSRAFKKLHGLTPTEAKKQSAKVMAFPRLSVDVNIKGETGIHYRIESIEFEFKIVGKEFTILAEQEMMQILNAWQGLVDTGDLQNIAKMSEPCINLLNGMLGVYGEGADHSALEYCYFIGVRTNKHDPQPYNWIVIKGGRWLVFTDLSDARRKLFSEWIPTLGYVIDQRPFIECILSPFDNTRNELWVPIK